MIKNEIKLYGILKRSSLMGIKLKCELKKKTVATNFGN